MTKKRRRRHTPEQIVKKLRDADAMLNSGKELAAVSLRSAWQSVWQVVKRSPPPRKPPGLMEMTKIVAQLGGYVNRKSAGPPGPQTMWIGLQRMHDIATCWLTFGPGANTCV